MISRTKSAMLAGTAVSVLFILGSTEAMAQDGQQGGPATTQRSVLASSFDEILVTARRREESMQDIPVAVSVLGGEAIERYASSNLNKIIQEMPQIMIVEGGSGNGASISIRGIGTAIGEAGLEQSVAVNIDGIQVSRGRVVTAAMFDVEQVEVLKGPQALFFGKNSPAGVISLNSKGPGEEFGGYVRAGYEFEAREKYAEGALDVPVSDTFGVRVALRGSTMRGWVRNTAEPVANPTPALADYPFPGANGSHLPNADNFTGRVTLAWQPTEDFELTLKSLYDQYSDKDWQSAAQNICQPGVLPVVNGVLDPYEDCVYDFRASSTDIPEGYAHNWPGIKKPQVYRKQKTSLTSLDMSYSFDELTVTSVTGFVKIDNHGMSNATRTSLGDIWNSSPEDSRIFTQELRLESDYDAPVNFMFGAYFEDAKRESRSTIRFGRFAPDPDNGNFYSIDRLADVNSKTYSAFGQLRWDVLDNLEVAGGVRYTKEKKNVDLRYNYVAQTFLNLGYREPGDSLLSNISDSNWSPEATVAWHPLEDLMVYAAYRTGYKSGGFSNPTLLATTTADQIQFQPEKAKGGEIGAKTKLLDGRLVGDLSIYRYTFDNLQVSSYYNPTNSFIVRNAAKARTTGVEATVNFLATEQLSLRGAVGYNKARYLSFPGAQCYAFQAVGCVGGSQDLAGQAMRRSPKWNMNLGASYDQPINSDLNLILSVDGKYTSKYFTIDSNDPFTVQSGFWLMNASARLASAQDWELAVIGRNLFNKLYLNDTINGVSMPAGTYQAFTPRTREVAIQATFNF